MLFTTLSSWKHPLYYDAPPYLITNLWLNKDHQNKFPHFKSLVNYTRICGYKGKCRLGGKEVHNQGTFKIFQFVLAET